jgi:methyltransferase (TIGR00027 family)
VRDSGASLTARWVAAQRARLSESRPSSADGNAEAEDRLYRSFSRAFVLPGLAPTAMAARTKFFDDETVMALTRGVRQIVIVGAGYDGRALRFRSPGVRWIEVDHPATQPDKQRRLARLGIPVKDITFVPVDLMTDDLGETLGQAGHDAIAPTLFICEGLFAYLPSHIAQTMCESLRDRAHRDSVLAANFRVAPRTDTTRRSLRAAVDGVLSVIGERRLNDFGPGDGESLIEKSGWRIVRRNTSTPSRLDGGTHLLVLAAEPDTR